MNRPQPQTAIPTSTPRAHLLRALASVVWAVVLTVTVSGGTSSGSVPVLAIAVLVSYPLIDVVASLVELRARREQARATESRLLLVNTVFSLVTAIGLGVAAGDGPGAALRVFGVWALLTGLIQVGSAVARRRRGDRGQWPMILSGGISSVAGLAFFQMGGQAEPALTVLAGYAVAGAVFLLVSVGLRRSPRDSEDKRVLTANQ